MDKNTFAHKRKVGAAKLQTTANCSGGADEKTFEPDARWNVLSKTDEVQIFHRLAPCFFCAP